MDPHNLKKAKTAAAESGIPIEFVREIGAPAVELIVQAGEDTDIGAIAFGGLPDLPGDVDWPHRNATDHVKKAHGDAAR